MRKHIVLNEFGQDVVLKTISVREFFEALNKLPSKRRHNYKYSQCKKQQARMLRKWEKRGLLHAFRYDQDFAHIQVYWEDVFSPSGKVHFRIPKPVRGHVYPDAKARKREREAGYYLHDRWIRSLPLRVRVQRISSDRKRRGFVPPSDTTKE